METTPSSNDQQQWRLTHLTETYKGLVTLAVEALRVRSVGPRRNLQTRQPCRTAQKRDVQKVVRSAKPTRRFPRLQLPVMNLGTCGLRCAPA